MAAPRPAIYTITPHKFTIYDSELSDADGDESESEEWVSISTSNTAGTLPNHITLRPRAHNVPTRSIVKKSDLERQIRNLKPSSSVSSVQIPKPHLSTLKTHIPTLKAIYIVNPTSLVSSSRHYLNTASHGPFSSFWNAHLSPIMMHVPSAGECYLRVCADCVRGRILLFCDGTWRADGPSVCERHVGVIDGNEGLASGPHWESERLRDRELFGVVVEVVQPLRRAETERSGIRVFDMGDKGEGDRVFVHSEECDCVEK